MTMLNARQEQQKQRQLKRRIMRRPLHAMLALTALAIPVSTQQAACFDTLTAINGDMQMELARIRNGGTPEPSYTYNLCPDTFFDATMTTLEPVLDNTMFVCGENGSRLNGCVIIGGNEQIRIQDSSLDGYIIQQLNFIGITFAGFGTSDEMTGASISALASSTTVATFTDVAWQVRESRSVPFLRQGDKN
jgi:hypothetical protein